MEKQILTFLEHKCTSIGSGLDKLDQNVVVGSVCYESFKTDLGI